MKILVVNCGSSSLKYQLFDMEGERVLAKGLCERIGSGGIISHSGRDGRSRHEEIPFPSHLEALEKALALLTDSELGVIKDLWEIDAVGHRIVHGGSFYGSSVLITPEVIRNIEVCIPLAPLHNPAHLIGIRACGRLLGDIPMAAVFDTAFHQTMPKKASTYAIPYRYTEEDGIRRYGFHGSSHRYIASRVAELMEKPLSELKIISCHLGSGSSICAIQGGKSVDTSMGFTAMAGLPMRTRCGDLDPSILEYIMDRRGMDIHALTKELNNASGIFSVAGISSGYRDIQKAAAEGNERALLALELFRYNVIKTVGGYAAAMNGVDALAFTGGWGEEDSALRESVCSSLAYLGLSLDPDSNLHAKGDILLSKESSKVRIFRIFTNEELVIARDTAALLHT